MSAAYDAIVAGVGTMGAAACAALAGRGARVLGLDASSIPNARSSHTGHTRVFRVAYSEHPDYVPLLKRAQAAWRALAEESGETLYRECGVLHLGPRRSASITRTAESARLHGLAHEELAGEALAAAFPQFRVPEGWSAILEPKAGWVAAEAGVSALAAQALRAGAELRAGEPVLEWRESGGGVLVRTPAGEHAADRFIVTCGAWSPRLLARIGVDLRVTRQVLVWVWPRRPEMFGDERFPVWAADTPHGHAYGFPFAPGRVGLKLALHERGAPTDPDALHRDLLPGDTEPLLRVLRDLIPDAHGPVLAHAACMYTNSPDGHFLIDRFPGSDRVVIAAGFSGHGFKFAPVIGEALADLALAGRTALPIGFLGLGRFARRTEP